MRIFSFLLICLVLPVTAAAFPWETFIPAITTCDSYPFPSCRARTLCKENGKYWYNGQCNQNKHPDQVELEKLDGTWSITIQFNVCDFGDFGWSIYTTGLALNKNFIYDDNSFIAHLEGNVLAIMEPQYDAGPCAEPCGYITDKSSYAMLAKSGYTYELNDPVTEWSYSTHCLGKNGEIFGIGSDDVGTYTFDLIAPNKMQGKACFAKADICLDFTANLYR